MALDALLDPAPVKRDGLAECRARVESEMASEIQRIEALVATGDKPGAHRALTDLDTKFGDLAARQILALSKQLR